MSLGVAHFAVGATVTTLALWLLWPRMAHSRSLVVLGGLWGMIPDIGKISMFETPEVLSFHSSPAANAFFGHRYLDVVDPGDSPEVAGFALAIFFLVSILAEIDAARLRRKRLDDPRGTVGTLRSRSSRGPPAAAGGRYTALVQRLVAVTAIATGVVVALLPLFGGASFVGILVGAGGALVLLGVDILLEDVRIAGAITQLIPAQIRAMVAIGISLGVVSVAAVLLSRVPLMTGLSIPYGALGLVLLVLLLRLWMPSETDRTGLTGPAP